MNCSVLILTYNEREALPGCLESVNWCDDIWVLDSHSNDGTQAIARAAGAHLVERVFDDYARQRNAGLALPFRHDWILILDADERCSSELATELGYVVSTTVPDVQLFRIRRKDFFQDRWIRRSSGYPTWFGRLVRVGCGQYEREINEELFVKGRVASLQSHIIHYPFLKGLEHWFARHNRYSTLEAKRLSVERRERVPWKACFSADPAMRRRFWKQVLYRLPLRPLVVFFGLYFIRLGILDGRPGFSFACMRAIYEYMIDLKIAEMQKS
jgi:glycosyltransferase involved in cell wall biosynthesis